MSEPENSEKNFLRRWSQRKRAAEAPAHDGATPVRSDPDGRAADTPARIGSGSEAAQPVFDPSSLPPIESIVAASDIRAFLAPGVPEELTRAALRRAWAADPTIREFIGIAENQWDFTKPDSVPGFGSLQLTPQVRRMVASLIGDSPGQDTPSRQADAEWEAQDAEVPTDLSSPAAPPAVDASDAGDVATKVAQSLSEFDFSQRSLPEAAEGIPRHSNNNVAMQSGARPDSESLRPAGRKHGGAVPK